MDPNELMKSMTFNLPELRQPKLPELRDYEAERNTR
jgi:hypothetical protein